MPIIVPEPVLARAAASYGLPLAGLRPLVRGGAPDGAVFTCASASGDVFLKLKPVPADAVDGERERAGFVAHLAASGIRVPEVVPSSSGAGIEFLDGPDCVFAVTVTRRVAGRHLRIPQDWSDDLVRSWGDVLGRLHAASSVDVPRALPTWREEHGAFMAGCRDDAVAPVWEEFGRVFEGLPADEACFGTVHNDLHLGNLMRADDGGLVVLDFDVSGRHWFATDIAIALAHPVWDLRRQWPAGVGAFVATFLDAYTARFPLAAAWRERLPLFMRYRLTLFLLAMQNELEHPASLPSELAEVRAWVLSGEPLVAPL